MKVVLTDRMIKSRPAAPKGKRADYADAIVPGLALRVTDRGHKSFVLVARYPANPTNPTRRALGDYGELTLETARDKARKWLELIGQGKDPRYEAAKEAAAERRKAVGTFRAIVEGYLERHQHLAKHDEAKRIMEGDFLKRWGDRPAADVTPEEVADAIRAIAKRAPAQAHNSLGHLRRIYAWAVGSHEFGLTASPVSVLKPKDLIGKRKARSRVLNADEVRAIWKVSSWTFDLEEGRRVRSAIGATDLGYPYGPVVRMLLLTGQREREVAEMRWSEIDLDQALWTIPEERMKSRRAHEVPLAPDALALLRSLPRFNDGDYVFTTTGGKKPVNGFSKTKGRLDQLSGARDWVLHDLRRTVRTGFSALPVEDLVREAVIAHSQKGLHAVYDRHSYRDEKRECLRLWEQRLRGTLAPKPPAEVANIEEARSARLAAQ